MGELYGTDLDVIAIRVMLWPASAGTPGRTARSGSTRA